MIGAIISATVMLVALYLVLTYSQGFGQSLGAVGQFYTSAVGTLQGRQSG